MPDQITLYQEIAQRHADAKHGEKQAILQESCERLGITMQQLYRRFDEIGYVSNRKKRSDKGETKINLDDARLVCSMMHESRRKNEKRLISCRQAIEIAYENGQISENYNPTSLLRIAEMHGFHPDQLAAPTPHVTMQSLHPNHAWQVDASIGTLFYMPKGGVEFFDEKKHYKNKPENMEKIKRDLCIRYVITDHYSGFIFVKYFAASGETQEILFDLLLDAFEKKNRIAMHGIPKIIIMDKGAANTAHSVRSFLNKLGIENFAHSTGNSRAKGSVEKAQDIVERNFEGGLRFAKAPVADMEQMNYLAQLWMPRFNDVEILTRAKQPRAQLWNTITADQLIIAPAREVLMALFTSKPQERRVNGDLTITFKGKGFEEAMRYSVEHVPDVKVNDKVLVTLNPFRSPNIDVIQIDIKGNETLYECTPLETSDAGFYVDAPIIGEGITAKADTVVDVERKASMKRAYNVDTLEQAEKLKGKNAQLFGGKIDPLIREKQYAKEMANVEQMPKRGTALDIEAPKQVLENITVAEACKRLKADLGSSYPADAYSILKKKYPDGIDPLQLDDIKQSLTTRSKLKVIGE